MDTPLKAKGRRTVRQKKSRTKEDPILSRLDTYLFNICFEANIRTADQLISEFNKPESSFLKDLDKINTRKLVDNFTSQGIMPLRESTLVRIWGELEAFSLN